MIKFSKFVVILSLICISFSSIFIRHTSASDIIKPWVSLSNLPLNLSNSFGLAFNDHIYNFGGANSIVPRTFIYTKINTDGTIGDWISLTSQPEPVFWHAGAIYNNHVYLLGGTDSSIITHDYTNMGIIGTDGDIAAWQALTPLPQTLSIGAAMVVGNKLYYAGGVTDPHRMYETAQDAIYMATINNSDGTIGEWSLAGNIFAKNFGMKIINIGNYFYEIGGYGADSDWHVRRALINSDGTIGNWEEQPYLKDHGFAMFGLARVQDYLFIVGGDTGGQTNKVYYTKINSDDTTSEWSEVSPESYLPEFLGNNAVVVNGNRIYSIGGQNTTGYYNNVYMTEFLGFNPTPSPTPTESPTPTPTDSPTPSPIPVNKIVFAPGLGGSWNLDAIMNCKTSNYSGDWTLAPFAKQVYRPFLESFGSTNWQLKTFYYDWRKDVRDSGSLLSEFINTNTLPNENVNFVGHSMGGLLGRSYIEAQNGGKLNSYLSVGTPHRGAVSSYPTFSAEQIENNDLIEKIATTILIKHCGVPSSIQNLLPTFDYLKDKNSGIIKPIVSMNAKNNYLNADNFVAPFWGVKVGTLSGAGEPTLKMYETIKPNAIDILRGYWLDGKPIKSIYDKNGDGTVLISSSQLVGASSNIVIDGSHQEIIGSANGIGEISKFLGTPQFAGAAFEKSNSALVLITDNGNFWTKDKRGDTTQSEQGIISLMNPKTGDFDFKFVPQKNNSLLIVAQFLPNGDVKYKEYKFKGVSPISKKIHFNSENPKEDIVD